MTVGSFFHDVKLFFAIRSLLALRSHEKQYMQTAIVAAATAMVF